MKIAITLLIILSYADLSMARNPDSLKIKGFLIYKYKKAEIQSYLKNKELKGKNLSYEMAIDFYEEIFFIPSDSTDKYGLSELLISNINYYNQHVFVFPTMNTVGLIKKYCNKDIKISGLDISCLNNLANSIFYLLNERNSFLYKIFYVEGYALSVDIENSSYNEICLDLKYKINPELKFFKSYFFYNITCISCDIKQVENFIFKNKD